MDESSQLLPCALPPLDEPEEAPEFVEWLLDDEAIARRGSNRLPKNSKQMVGKYLCRAGDRHLRRDDFRERLFVAFQALRQAGYSNRDACLFLAEVRSVKRRLVWSRPRESRPDTHRVAETIRSSVSKFKAPLQESLLERWVCSYRLFQVNEDERAEYEQVVRVMRKLVAEGIFRPLQPDLASDLSDSQDEGGKR